MMYNAEVKIWIYFMRFTTELLYQHTNPYDIIHNTELTTAKYLK